MKTFFRNVKTEKDLDSLKRELVKEKYFRTFPNNADILAFYKDRIKQGREKRTLKTEFLLRKIKTKSNSGIVSVSLLMKPYACPGNCLYCPAEESMPKSYLSNEPAVMRARNTLEQFV